MALFSRCEKLWKRVNTEVLLAFAMIMYFADIISDVVLGVTYMRESDIWHGVLTLLFVVISHIVWLIFLINYRRSKYHRGGNKLLYILKYFLIPPPIHMFFEWKKDQIKDKIITRNPWGLTLVRENMSLIELFLESIPQLCLQAYIILATQGYITTLQAVTCSISLLAASYGTVCEFDGYFRKCFVFVTNIFWLFTRVVAIAMLGCIKTYIPFIFVIGNMFIFVLLQFYDRFSFRITSVNIFKDQLMFAAKCSFLPIYSLRTFEVATFLILENGVAFVVSGKFGITKSVTLKNILVNATATTNSTWLSPNVTYIYQGMNKTQLSKHDTSDVLLSEWEYFQPLMIIFIVFSILAILPHAINFVLLVMKSRYYIIFASKHSLASRLPKLLRLMKPMDIKEIDELMCREAMELKINRSINRKSTFNFSNLF